MSRDPKLPGLPAPPPTGSAALDRFLQMVMERLEVREGTRGDPLAAVVTRRDLKKVGLDVLLVSGAVVPNRTEPGLLMQNPDGTYTPVSADSFAQGIFGTKLFQTLRKSINDPTRFDGLVPEEVKRLILQSIADEAAKRGADVRRVEQKFQSGTESLAYAIQEVTAAVGSAQAGVRETTYASATANKAMAGQITQVTVRLDDVGGVTIEQALTAVADSVDGLHGQWTVKIGTNNAVAGFGLALSDPIAGPATSAFIVMADKFAVVSATDLISDPANPPLNRVPFGIDTVTDTIYINGNVRINANGTTLNDLAAATGIVVSATSGVWKVDNTGAAVNTSITLTASLTGTLTGFVTWSRNGTGTTVPTAGTTNTWVIYADDQPGDSVTYTATLVDDGVTYYDSVTVNRLRDGVNAITVRLSNQTASVSALPDGTGANYATANGTIEVYQGLTLLESPAVSFALAPSGNPYSLTYTLNSTTGAYSVTGGMSGDVADITFQATVAATGLVVPAKFTLSKNKQGITGEPGTTGEDAALLSLTATGFAFVYKDTAATSSTSPAIDITAVLQNVVDTVVFVATAYNASNVSLGTVTLTGTGNTRTLTAANFGALGTTTTKYVKVTATAGVLSDTVTVYRGDGGADSSTMILTNEAHTVPAAFDGTVSSFTGASTIVRVFRGITDETSSWTISKSDSSLTTTLTGSGGSTPTVTATAMAADVGTSTITASRSGFPSMSKVFTVTKSRAGAVGDTGAAGSPGTRGSITRYGSLSSTGSEWNGTDIATANSLVGGSGNQIIGDTVTLSSSTNAITRYWTGSAWTNPGVVINGDLLVGGMISTTEVNTQKGVRAYGSYSDGSTQAAIWGENSTHDGYAVVGICDSGIGAGAGYFEGGAAAAITAVNSSGVAISASGRVTITALTASVGVTITNSSGVGLSVSSVSGAALQLAGTGTINWGGVTTLKPPNNTTTFLRGDGQWALISSITSGVSSFSAGTTGLTPSTGTTGAVTLAGTLNVANGGTGSTTASGARSNLGLGSLATLSSVNNSNWSGTALSIANGGTGATTAAAALAALGGVSNSSGTAYNSDRLGGFVAVDHFRATGTAGSAGSLLGYITTVVGGSTVKIPYYAV